MNDIEHTVQAPTPTDSPLVAGDNDNPAAADRWSALGFTPADGGGYLTPADLIVFEISDAAARPAIVQTLMHMGEPPRLNVKIGAAEQTFFRLADPELAATLKRSVPAGVYVRTGGDTIQLPDTAAWATPTSFPATAADLSAITAVEVSRIAKADLPTAQPLIERTPLTAMSLRGLSAEFRARAVEAKPLLADLCFSGQVTTWYAAPNTGKTLITLNLLVDAVREGRVTGGNVYYINADDGSDGIATKMEILDPLEVHTLVPGFREFNPIELAGKLTKMGVREQSRGVFVIIDTTKKFASLMDKREATAFGTACRQVAMNGGAVLNLAHTTKNPNADGTPRYSGTTDLLEDADAAYTIAKVDSGGEAGERVVEFKCFKQRGPNAETAAYAYDAAPDTSYLDRFASVRRVDLEALDQFKRVEAQRADAEVIEIVRKCIAEGHNSKILLGKEAAKRAGVSVRQAYLLVERYTGTDPAQHRWSFSVGGHGIHRFELLPLAA
ncbi:helicase RepA family protein [Sphingomonas sp. RHCKR47]|uniref:AAA family ATPase n=1 Tax=Sphingomonas citricola TaxID=2862498 RepID=UPI001C66DF09|nr:AAA family ATPase [Sphingomonas citricola]MBW6524610.1 helicase RepA family protein [Sphingomonas citricola]